MLRDHANSVALGPDPSRHSGKRLHCRPAAQGMPPLRRHLRQRQQHEGTECNGGMRKNQPSALKMMEFQDT